MSAVTIPFKHRHYVQGHECSDNRFPANHSLCTVYRAAPVPHHLPAGSRNVWLPNALTYANTSASSAGSTGSAWGRLRTVLSSSGRRSETVAVALALTHGDRMDVNSCSITHGRSMRADSHGLVVMVTGVEARVDLGRPINIVWVGTTVISRNRNQSIVCETLQLHHTTQTRRQSVRTMQRSLARIQSIAGHDNILRQPYTTTL